LALANPAPASLQSPSSRRALPRPADENRHYDARIEFNEGFVARKSRATMEAAQSLAGEQKDLALTYDEPTGALRSLSIHAGYLTGARPGVDALQVATEYARENLGLLGLEDSDFAEYEVTDRVFSRVTGATHVYLRQTYRGLPVYNTQLHVNVSRDGRLLSVNNSFLPAIARSPGDVNPALDLAAAVQKAAAHIGIPIAEA